MQYKKTVRLFFKKKSEIGQAREDGFKKERCLHRSLGSYQLRAVGSEMVGSVAVE
ncbi:MAG: hypothetical protein SD837_09040 [Candidatus Electrothrix scaldis]|nr:MAG: hypothetical protein SD837_09040 [Candidatus Electrothrix sp. GW3-3]